MKASKKSASSRRAQPVLMTCYEVSEYRTITDPRVREPTSRADVFKSVSPALIHSTGRLIDEVQGRLPLDSHFSYLAYCYLSEIEHELKDGDTSLGLIERRHLKFLAAQLRDDPDSAWQNWVRHEGDPGLASFKEHIQEWLDEEIDWNESDWFDSGSSGQSSALNFFSSLHSDVCEALGVVIIEGEHPGSSYYAAELESGINEANSAAEALGLDFKFRAEGEVAADSQVPSPVTADQGASE